MSLKVWLPLIGDLHNQGISGITATGHSVTSFATGKIGSCYQFAASAIELDDNVFDNNVTEFTIAAWMKFNSNDSACLFSDRTAINSTGITCFIMDSGDIFFDVGDRWQFIPSITIPRTSWFHIAFLYKKGSLRQVYLNGILIGSTTSAPAPTATSTSHSFIGASQNSSTALGGNYFNGWMNDVRIYDHCLSVAEVKKIAQGLVLHYKLDGGLFGNPNLLLNTHFDNRYSQTTGWDTTKNGTLLANNWGGYNSGVANQATCYHAHLKLFDDEYVYEYIKDTETWLGISQGGLQSKLIAGKTYTFSCEQYSVTNTNYMYGGLYYYKTNATSASFHLGYISCNTNRQQNTWQKFTYTFTAPSDGDYSKNMSWYCYGHSGGAGTFYLRHLKLEEGNIATPWCPADSEKNIDRTIIEDSSGYDYNGTVIGNPTISSDTIRYSSCTNFPTNIDGILSTFPLSLWNHAFTYSFWIKPSGENGGRSIYAASYNGTSCSIEKTAGNKLRFYWNGSPDLITSSLTIIDGVWQHIAIVKSEDKTKVYCYYNGELKDTFTNTFSDRTFSGNLRIARDTREDATSYIGLMSDFRIYCTALLDTDIKQLYNVGMKMDKFGNMYTGTINEEDNSITSFKKTAIIKSTTLFEQKDDMTQVKIGKSQIPIINVATYGSGNTPSGAFIRATKDGTTSEGSLTKDLLSYKGKNIKFSYNVTAEGPRTGTNFGLQIVCVQAIPPSSPQGSPTINQTLLCTEGLQYSGSLARLEQYCKLPANANVLQTVVVTNARPAQNNDNTWEISNLQIEEVSTLGTFTTVPITEELELTEQPVNWITANAFIEF